MAFWLPSTFPPPDNHAMPYFVYLTNAAQVAALQAAYPLGLTGVAPAAAAVTYSAPLIDTTGIQSLYWIGTPFADPNPPPGTYYINNLFYAYDVTVASGLAPSTDPDYDFAPAPYYWVGFFRFWNTEPGVYSIGKRRWVEGFEAPAFGAGGSGTILPSISRDASRTNDGFGFAMRGSSNSTFRRSLTQFAGSLIDGKQSWEVLYVRLRRTPAANVNFWRCYSSGQPSGGAGLYITPTGTIAGFNIDNASAIEGATFGSSSVLTLDQWYRLDVRIKYAEAPGPCVFPTQTPGTGRLELFLNEVSQFVGTRSMFTLPCAPAGEGIGFAGTSPTFSSLHAASTVGNSFILVNDLELDIDDWVNIAPVLYDLGGTQIALFPPTAADACKDWEGHHVILVRATGFGASHDATWTGDFRNVLQNPVDGADFNTNVNTTTSGARMAVTTDYLEPPSLTPAMAIGYFNRNAAAIGVGYTLGFSAAGGGDQLQAISVSPDTWTAVQYTVDPGTVLVSSFSPFTPVAPPADPPLLYPIELLHVNAATTSLKRVQALVGQAEGLGHWGAVDISPEAPTVTQQVPTGIHNSPYPGIQQSESVPAPLSAYSIMSGIYTGDAFGQDVLLQFPGHWWWVRPLTGGAGGARWWSTTLTGHRSLNRETVAGLMPQALIDTLGQVRFREAGANADNNANLVSYQWVAVSDPGMRYLLNGAVSHKGLTAATNALVDAGFTAEAGFFLDEIIVNGTTPRMWYKGIGHAPATASLLSAAETPNVVTFNAGALAVQSPLWVDATNAQTAFSVWRRSDGSGTVGVPFGLVTWTGDGTGARVISIDLGDRFPLWVLVCPHNGQSWVRDPSHTGANSSNAAQTTTDTAHITAGGLNSFTVATALNALGIVYDAFILPGCAASWANLSVCIPGGTLFPVPPAPAPGDQFTTPPAPPITTGGAGLVLFGNGVDSGGGAGCSATIANGTDSGGESCG